MSRFKLYQQLEMSDCGPACIQMVCAYYGKEHSLQSIKKEISVSRIGVTVGDVKRTCEKFGLFTLAVRGTVEQLSKISSPAILHWRGNHFVVRYCVKLKKQTSRIFYCRPINR